MAATLTPQSPGARADLAAVPGLLSRTIHNPWLRFTARRVLSLVVILFGLVTVTFAMVRLVPGNPAEIIGGLSATRQDIANIRHQLGLDQSVLGQYGTFLGHLFHFDLGTSFYTGQRVTSLIGERAPTSAELAGGALVLVMVVSIPGGMLAAALTRENRHPKTEVAFTAVTSVFGAVPEFLMATFLAFIFAVALRVLPVAGNQGFTSLILPILAISLRPIAFLLRLIRVEALNVLSQDYIRTAKAKRIPSWLIYLRHVMPNAITAALTIGGLLFANLIGGAVVVENVFNLNGLGTALVQGILGHDYPVVQGIVLVLGVIVVLVNAIVDTLLVTIDPRSLIREA